MVVQRPRFQWSVDDYHKLIKHGILTENHDVELIRGDIVCNFPKSDAHVSCSLLLLNRAFRRLARDHAILSAHDPIRLADSEPEPDFALLVRRDDLYLCGKPWPADTYLVVEAADASLEYDRKVKGPLYAENSIAEYWIVNLVDCCLEVHRDPQPDGTYADTRTLRPGDSIALALLPAVSVAVGDIIP